MLGSVMKATVGAAILATIFQGLSNAPVHLVYSWLATVWIAKVRHEHHQFRDI